MGNSVKYSKLEKNGQLELLAVFYFDDLYKASVVVEVKNNKFHVTDMLNYPHTDYSSFDEIINKSINEVIAECGMQTTAVSTAITKEEFDNLIKAHDLQNDYISKIKEKFLEEVIKALLIENHKTEA
ncbi:hypothetical protein [Paenibacillus alvei]|uniref:Uncharacterized protein n=1 Tax=Paenibacillus alvei TaxID=44250 RepID=A0AAP7A3L0_PAEAL|nr:hypothetical protein [Paenibacillus alvei]NOJ73979.1 hypothetical protein [Paenibacillus alvei]